ncbi:hypothetical protein AB0E62_27325 [Streptomyces sp. NPDC038707]|uniref:hypothetical protein n=1 Tax=Streptomyces sp. NPDC038707 TaxID=3154329 RepID=UPI0033F94D55
MGWFSRSSSEQSDYEQKHTAWRQARRDLDAAYSQERRSVFASVNHERAAEQAAVKDEIKQAEQNEAAARKALNFTWEQ